MKGNKMKLKYSEKIPEHKEEIKLTKDYLRWHEVLPCEKEAVITYCSDMETEENVRYSVDENFVERTVVLFTNIDWVCIDDTLYVS